MWELKTADDKILFLVGTIDNIHKKIKISRLTWKIKNNLEILRVFLWRNIHNSFKKELWDVAEFVDRFLNGYVSVIK